MKLLVPFPHNAQVSMNLSIGEARTQAQDGRTQGVPVQRGALLLSRLARIFTTGKHVIPP